MLTARPLARRLTTALAATLVLAACGASDETADDAPDAPTVAGAGSSTSPASPTTDTGPTTDTDADPVVGTDGDAATSPVLAVTATDPDGATFTIGDSLGSPVLVETFATWCSTCRSQLTSTQAAAAEAGDDAVFLALSVEVDLDPATLAEYAAANGFDDILFGVLDEDGLVALQQEYGGTVLVPPSTPKFRVDADGSLSDLATGAESSQEILATLGL